ncbi:hypothetical protein O181_008005 [Austropuccinia psidii MF-1]|uniref:Uncharacterized protein n=1 Tax=Austropuccinia psidii MF-1 TaxID=1389203 RepID=A0A9Q3BNI2_9BASI|nr:hypothetical protein [Austropuccinia psidii MF-1]
MEETIQSNQMDVDKEEVRQSPDLESLPHERHVWRIPEFPPFPKGLNHFQVEAIEIYQFQYKTWYRAPKDKEWEICPSLWQGAMSSYSHIKSFLGQEKTIEQCQKKKLVEEPKSFIYGPEERAGNDPSFGEERRSGINQIQKCPKTIPKDLRKNREVPRAIKAIGKDLTHNVTGSLSWSLQPWKVFSICSELLFNSKPKSRKG